MVKIIAIITDFGNKDSYVGVMKGVMLGINSSLRFVDVSHEIDPFNVPSAAYVLYTAWDYFPDDTTFLTVVDPGVGSSREILLCRIGNKFLVAPDNGVISLLYKMKRNVQCYHLDGLALEKVFTSDNHTFHGRNIFSPLAANIATYGLDFVVAKQEVTPVLLDELEPEINWPKGLLRGRILHVDRFGNCITNVYDADLEGVQNPESLELHIGGHTIRGLSRYFAEVEVGKGLCYLGSSGFLEIGIREGNAFRGLKLRNSMDFTIKNLKK